MKFSEFIDIKRDLLASAGTAVRESLQAKAGERALIIANPVKDSALIAMALHDAFIDAGATAVLLYQEQKSQLDYADDAVIEAIKSKPDMVLSISADKLGKDRNGMAEPYEYVGRKFHHIYHYYMHGTKELRSFWSPSVTIDTFTRTVPIDYMQLHAECNKVKAVLDKGVAVHVTSKKGTDVTFSIAGRMGMLDDGILAKAGSGGNIPAGETYISPVCDSADGLIVFDGSISSHNGVIIIDTPIQVRYRDGYIHDISGGSEAEQLKDTIRLGEDKALTMERDGQLPPGAGTIYKKNARALGELGIGLNRKAKIIGNMLEDEKVYRTCHFAIGQNYDGDGPALIHLDGLVKNPTLVVCMDDGSEVLLMKDGELLL